jgi:hypothetical protein
MADTCVARKLPGKACPLDRRTCTLAGPLSTTSQECTPPHDCMCLLARHESTSACCLTRDRSLARQAGARGCQRVQDRPHVHFGAQGVWAQGRWRAVRAPTAARAPGGADVRRRPGDGCLQLPPVCWRWQSSHAAVQMSLCFAVSSTAIYVAVLCAYIAQDTGELAPAAAGVGVHVCWWLGLLLRSHYQALLPVLWHHQSRLQRWLQMGLHPAS